MSCIYLFYIFNKSKTSNESSQLKVQKPPNAAECFNGAVLEKYMWSQTGSDVDVRIPVAGNIKGKDVCVEIKDKYLKVALKNIPGASVVLMFNFVVNFLQTFSVAKRRL
jgi:hypothetical protein